jgi:hypothetical protein
MPFRDTRFIGEREQRFLYISRDVHFGHGGVDVLFCCCFENQEGWRHGSTQISFCERRELLPWDPPGAFGLKNKVHGCDAEETGKREKK